MVRGHRRHHGPGSASRCRWWNDDGSHWEVRARIERFVEPALLLVLRDTETHGYELAEELQQMTPDDPIDLGNLYRLLRSIEDEGLVRSRWRDDLPGRSKRTYELTADGAALLEVWADGLRASNRTISTFLDRHDRRPGRAAKRRPS
jgi:DNA-binding PadR family transcriptional regulator